MNDLERFKKKVETFIQKEGLTPTGFGSKYTGDPNFVFELRGGREPHYSTMQKVLDAMKAKKEA